MKLLSRLWKISRDATMPQQITGRKAPPTDQVLHLKPPFRGLYVGPFKGLAVFCITPRKGSHVGLVNPCKGYVLNTPGTAEPQSCAGGPRGFIDVPAKAGQDSRIPHIGIMENKMEPTIMGVI